MTEEQASYNASDETQQTIIGCTTIIVTLTPEYEIEELHIQRKGTTLHGVFGWSPTVLQEDKGKGTWYVKHIGGGYPVKPSDEYAVNLESTHTLLVYIARNFLSPQIYRTLQALVANEKEVYLIKSGAFTLNQTPIIQRIYKLKQMDIGEWTYITLEEVDEGTVEVHTHREPERVE